MTIKRFIRVKVLNAIAIGLIFFSCKHKVESVYSDRLLGDWICIDNDGRKIKSGYQFLPGSICENKLGYFKKVITKIPGMEKAIGGNTEQKKTYFLGTTTKYKIEGSTLKIFNLSDSVWEEMKILDISSDTISFLKNNGDTSKYAKLYYPVNDNVLFDELVVSSSACLGQCPINNIIISKSGKIIYYGEKYNIRNGTYTSCISNEQFSQIEMSFRKAGIMNLNENYIASHTDGVTVSLTFLKNNKIIKSIIDYGNEAPTQLYWAYMPVRNLYDLIKLDTVSFVQPLIGSVTDMMFNLLLSTSLSQSEAFYLCNLLRQSKLTNASFTKEYQIEFHLAGGKVVLETDGQFYKFVMSSGNSLTMDIGFNFIKRNSLEDNFKKRDGKKF